MTNSVFQTPKCVMVNFEFLDPFSLGCHSRSLSLLGHPFIIHHPVLPSYILNASPCGRRVHPRFTAIWYGTPRAITATAKDRIISRSRNHRSLPHLDMPTVPVRWEESGGRDSYTLRARDPGSPKGVGSASSAFSFGMFAGRASPRCFSMASSASRAKPVYGIHGSRRRCSVLLPGHSPQRSYLDSMSTGHPSTGPCISSR